MGCVANGTPLHSIVLLHGTGAAPFEPLGAEEDDIVVVRLEVLLLARHVGAPHHKVGGEGGGAHPVEVRRGRDCHS